MTEFSNVPDWSVVEPVGGQRHLPVYLLLDTSGSMTGAPIEAVRRGVEMFQQEVSSDQFARDVVKVGVITFDSDARLVTNGLVPIEDFLPPTLQAAKSGSTCLGKAFQVLLDSMDKHVVKGVKGGHKGDWKPVVFVLTDGRPTDEWRGPRDAVINRPKGAIKPSVIVAVGCGPDVDDATLKGIAWIDKKKDEEKTRPLAFRIDDNDTSFVVLFKYLTQSVVSSVQPGGNVENPFENISPPDDLIRIP